jgi:MFS family permease
VIGPLAGAIAAARLGFHESFVLGGLVLVACGALVHWGVPASGAREERRAAAGPTPWREVMAVALMLMAGSTQIFFLTSILPQVLPPLGVEPARTLEVGGFVIFASGAAAALGSMLAPRLSDVWPEHRLIVALLVASSLAVAALAFVHSAWLYGALRFLQVLFIAPIFPIVVSRITQSAGGEAIGLINSARIGAAFIGPVIATTMLAWTSPAVLYVVLAAIGLACLPLATVRARTVSR